MARKDHLVTIQEEDKSSKKAFKRNNAILFQAIQPTIANEINGIGATSKTPDEIKDIKFPILNPINAIGKNTDGTVNVDLSLENSPFVGIELSDVGATISAITINLLSLVKNFAERFILDITKDPANVSTPTVTFSPTVENLPAGFPDNDPRYLLEVVARETPTETRFEIVNRLGTPGSTLPAGTVENEHLEWDNTATDWFAVQSSTYGATGPFADTGFLRFANDNIMTSQRNAADTGNLETKVTTLDAFDFTNSLNSTDVVLQIRAQHLTNPDAIFSIQQDFDDGASGDITTFTAPQSILFNVNSVIAMTVGPTEIDIQLNTLDMNLGDILDVNILAGRDDGTIFTILFNRLSGNDTKITNDVGDANRINFVNNGTNSFLFFEDTSRTPTMFFFGPPSSVESVVSASNGVFEAASRVVPADGVVNNDAILFYADTATDPVRILFKRKTVAGVVSTGTFVYSPLDFTLDMNNQILSDVNTILFNDSVGGAFSATNPVMFYNLSDTALVIQTNFGQSIELYAGNAAGDRFADMTKSLYDFSIVSGSEFRTQALHVFNISQFDENMVLEVDTPTGANPTFSLSQLVDDAGTGGDLGTSAAPWNNLNIEQIRLREGDEIIDISSIAHRADKLRINAATGDTIVHMINGVIQFEWNVDKMDINDNFIQFDARAVPSPDPPATELFLFSDSTNSDHLSIRRIGSTIDLESGGGVSFPITPTVDVRGTVTIAQAVDISQADGHVTTMTLGAASITVTFSGFPAANTQQTWELHVTQDATGGRTLVISPTPVESFTIANGANLLTILTFLTNDGGTDIHVIPSLRGSISLSGTFLPLAGGTMTGDITMSAANIVMGNNNLLTVKDIQFQNGGTVTAGTSMITSDTSGDMLLNVAINDGIFFRVNDTRVLQIGLNANDSFAQITSLDSVRPNLIFFRDDSTMTAGAELGAIEFTSNDGGGVSMEYAEIRIDTENVTAANEAGGMHLGVTINGDVSATTFLSLNNSDDDKITPFKNIHMAAGIDIEMVTNDIWLDEVADGTRISGTATALNMRVGGTFVSSYSSSALSLQGSTVLSIADLFTLTNTASLPAAAINAIWADTGGMNFNIASGEVYDFFTGGSSKLQIDNAGGLTWTLSGVGHGIDAGATSWTVTTGALTDAINLQLLNSTHRFQITDTATVWEDPLGPLIFSFFLNDTSVAPTDVQNVGTLQWRANDDLGTETNVLSINPQVIVSNDTDWQTQITISAGKSVGNILLGSDDGVPEVGFFNVGPVVKQSVASDTLANLYTALRNYGLIV